MKLGGRKIRARKIGHKALHKVGVGSRAIHHGADFAGQVLRTTGRMTGNPALVEAGRGVERVGDVAGKVGRVSRSLEKVI